MLCPPPPDEDDEFVWAERPVSRPPGSLPDRMHLWVDGDLFRIERAEPERPDTFDYTRLTGPDPGHGFSTGVEPSGPRMVDHLEECRWFLWIVDPVTGDHQTRHATSTRTRGATP